MGNTCGTANNDDTDASAQSISTQFGSVDEFAQSFSNRPPKPLTLDERSKLVQSLRYPNCMIFSESTESIQASKEDFEKLGRLSQLDQVIHIVSRLDQKGFRCNSVTDLIRAVDDELSGRGTFSGSQGAEIQVRQPPAGTTRAVQKLYQVLPTRFKGIRTCFLDLTWKTMEEQLQSLNDAFPELKTLNKLHLKRIDSHRDLDSDARCIHLMGSIIGQLRDSQVTHLQLAGMEYDENLLLSLGHSLSANYTLVFLGLQFATANGHQRNMSEFSVALMSALQNSEFLAFINISGLRFNADTCLLLLTLLKRSKTLTSLNLRRNNLLLCFDKLTDAVQSCSTLSRLDLSRNNLTDPMIFRCVSGLAGSHIVSLNLSYNRCRLISEDLIAAFSHNNTFVSLNLRGNVSIGQQDNAADALIKILTTSTELKEFDISQCNLSHESIVALGEGLRAADDMSHLQHLLLASNDIDNKTLQTFLTSIIDGTKLGVLDLSNNCITSEAAASIDFFVSSYSSLVHLSLEDNPVFADCLATRKLLRRRMEHANGVYFSTHNIQVSFDSPDQADAMGGFTIYNTGEEVAFMVECTNAVRYTCQPFIGFMPKNKERKIRIAACDPLGSPNLESGQVDQVRVYLLPLTPELDQQGVSACDFWTRTDFSPDQARVFTLRIECAMDWKMDEKAPLTPKNQAAHQPEAMSPTSRSLFGDSKTEIDLGIHVDFGNEPAQSAPLSPRSDNQDSDASISEDSEDASKLQFSPPLSAIRKRQSISKSVLDDMEGDGTISGKSLVDLSTSEKHLRLATLKNRVRNLQSQFGLDVGLSPETRRVSITRMQDAISPKANTASISHYLSPESQSGQWLSMSDDERQRSNSGQAEDHLDLGNGIAKSSGVPVGVEIQSPEPSHRQRCSHSDVAAAAIEATQLNEQIDLLEDSLGIKKPSVSTALFDRCDLKEDDLGADERENASCKKKNCESYHGGIDEEDNKTNDNEQVETATTLTASFLGDSERIKHMGDTLESLGMSIATLRQALLKLDVDILTPEHVGQLSGIKPLPEDLRAAEQHGNSHVFEDNQVRVQENFICMVLSVPSYLMRLQLLQFRHKFDVGMTINRKNISNVKLACQEITESKALKKVLKVLIRLGEEKWGVQLQDQNSLNFHLLASLNSKFVPTDGESKSSQTVNQALVREVGAATVKELLQELSHVEIAAETKVPVIKASFKSFHRALSAIAKQKNLLLSSKQANENDLFLPELQSFVENAQGFMKQSIDELKEANSKSRGVALSFGQANMDWDQVFHYFGQFLSHIRSDFVN